MFDGFDFFFFSCTGMAKFPMWIRHGGTFGSNLKYIGDKLVGKLLSLR